MLFGLDIIRARKGDCLILHYGSEDDPRLAMIDGGPRGVYAPNLRPRLEKIREMRGVKENEPLQVDLLMVSHVDDDHIQGILDMTKELTGAQMEKKPQLVQVLSFWHNSFENIIGNTPKELTAAFTSHFGAASMGGDPPDLTLEVDDEDEETISSSLGVLASIKQGAQLRSDVNKLDFPLNPEFDGKLILAQGKGEVIDMENGLKVTVAGPMLPELKDLHEKHQEWLKDLAKEGKTAEDVLSAYVDKSVPNLSSLVVLAEAGDKRILLTGDARGDKIMEGLELVGLLEKGGKIHVDILKVPHHGSSNNLDNDFFERITAEHYVFSGDGEHGNPERETMEMLLNARGNADYTIHLTYPIDEVDAGRKADWEKEQNKEKKKKEKNPAKKVRPDWSIEENSLQALFDAHPDFGKKVSSVEDGKPHIINLLEEVGF
jgi:hypothetical protein